MKRMRFATAAGLLLAAAGIGGAADLTGAPAQDRAAAPRPPAKVVKHEHKEGTCPVCGNDTYGTSVEWADTPSDAAAKAAKEQKLLMVLHVSGHFEDPGFT